MDGPLVSLERRLNSWCFWHGHCNFHVLTRPVAQFSLNRFWRLNFVIDHLATTEAINLCFHDAYCVCMWTPGYPKMLSNHLIDCSRYVTVFGTVVLQPCLRWSFSMRYLWMAFFYVCQLTVGMLRPRSGLGLGLEPKLMAPPLASWQLVSTSWIYGLEPC